MQTKGIRLLKVDTHPDRPWLVSVPPSVFGKQIHQRFKSYDEAKLQMHSYVMEAAQNQQAYLDPDIYRVVDSFQNKLSATQLMEALTNAVELKTCHS